MDRNHLAKNSKRLQWRWYFYANESGSSTRWPQIKHTSLKRRNELEESRWKIALQFLYVQIWQARKKEKFLWLKSQLSQECFKNVKHLPATYKTNKKTWMAYDIFEEHIRSWDKDLRNNNRKILLLVDNYPAHSELKNLTNITLVFLLPNMTSILQPIDQGVIKNLKFHYRKSPIMHMTDC